MATNTITTKDASDVTKTLATVDVESGVLLGASAATRLRYLHKVTDAFGVTTTAYAANDVVDTKITLSAVAARNGASLAIVNAKIVMAQSMPSTNPIFVLHIFNQDPSSSTFTDNSGIAVVEADAAYYAGAIDMTGYRRLASGVYVFDSGSVSLECQCASGADDLYAVLEIKSATTFAADEMHLHLTIEQDR